VLGGADDRLGASQLAARVEQVCGVHQPTALVTLVAARILQVFNSGCGGGEECV
jgi:hypothetical protein